MKPLIGSKVLCALLAVLAIGMGVQTFYLVKLNRQLGETDVHAAEQTESPKVSSGSAQDDSTGALTPVLPTDPFSQLDEAEERMRSLFDDFYERFDSGFGESWFDRHPFFADGDSFLFSPTGQLGPRVDLQDRGDHYEMLVDVPGADETEISVRTEDSMLVIEGTRNATLEESNPGNYVRRERHAGRFERKLTLPADADPATLETEYEDGVFKVTIQKVG